MLNGNGGIKNLALEKLPNFKQAENLIDSMSKSFIKGDQKKRGRKRHNTYRKQYWYKTCKRNVYEPRIVPKFYFQVNKTQIEKSLCQDI